MTIHYPAKYDDIHNYYEHVQIQTHNTTLTSAALLFHLQAIKHTSLRGGSLLRLHALLV